MLCMCVCDIGVFAEKIQVLANRCMRSIRLLKDGKAKKNVRKASWVPSVENFLSKLNRMLNPIAHFYTG